MDFFDSLTWLVIMTVVLVATVLAGALNYRHRPKESSAKKSEKNLLLDYLAAVLVAACGIVILLAHNFVIGAIWIACASANGLLTLMISSEHDVGLQRQVKPDG